MRSFFIKFFLLLALLSTLVSCGGSKVTKAEFVVGKGFSISNSGYEGGLTIYGRHLITNESFAYSSLPNSGQNQIVLDLAKGPWSFGVVGWSGNGTDNNLKGSAYCGGVDQVDLSSASQTINLSATIANCLSSKFASPSMVMTPPEQSLKALQLFMCPKISSGTTSSTASFCSDLSLDESVGDDIWGIKLRLPHQPLPGTTPGTIVESACISASSLGYFDLGGYQIPTKNLPLNIIAFKNKDCSQPSNAFSFERGIEADYTSAFDKNLFYPASAENPKLFLASTRTKRDSSPLESLIPKITCSGSSCSFIKSLPAGTDFVIDGGQAGSKSQIILSYNESCASFSNFPTTGDLIAGNCENRRGGGAILEVLTTAAGNCEPSNCTLSYDHNGSTINKSVKALPGPESPSLWQQERLISYLGIENSMYSNPLVFSLGHLDNIKRSNGILHDISEMFSAHGPGGAYKGIASCSDLSGTRFVDVFDDGTYKRYQVEIISIAENAPRQICGDTVNADGTCTTTLDKKMILREPSSVIFKTTDVIKFDCTPNSKIGYSEGAWSDVENDGQRNEKVITYWNTKDELQPKVQQYRYEQKTNLSGQLINLRTQFIDISRGDYSTFENSILISDSSYEYYFDPETNNKTERISRSEYAVTTETDVYTNFKEYFNSTATSAGGLFVMPEVEQFLKAKSIHQDLVSNGDFIQTATSQNGNYSLIVNFTTGMSFSYKIYNGSTYKAGTGNLSAAFTKANISINDNGKAVIAYAKSPWVKFLAIDGSLTTPTISSEIDPSLYVSPLNKIQVFIGNDDLITVAATNYSNNVLAKIVDLAGLIPTGNLSYGFDYISSFSANEFIIRHTDGMNANLCYASSGYLKCLKLIFPTQPYVSANFSIPTGPSGNINPSILVTGLSGSSLEFFRDSSCLHSISSAGAVSGTIMTTGLNLGLNDIYYKIYGGACTFTNTSYYKSNTGRYEDVIVPQITSSEGILSRQSVIESGNFVFNYVDNSMLPQKVTFNGNAITPTTSIGSNLTVRRNDQIQSKLTDIGLSSPNSSPGDFDKGDVPVKYPLYDGSLSGLKPQTFFNLFTPSATFSGQ